MRRTLSIAAVMVFLMLGAAAGASADDDGGGIVYGSGATVPNNFDIAVREKEGRPDRGAGYVRASPNVVDAIKANGPATCVDIRGNMVGILYRFDDTTRPSVGKNLLLFVTLIDGGPQGIDLGGILGPFPADPGLGCAPNPAIVNFGPVVRGDIVVRDTVR